MIDLPAAAMLDVLASLVLLALAALVWAIRSRSAAATCFGLLCAGAAVFYLTSSGGVLRSPAATLVATAMLGVGFAGVAFLVPVRLGSADRSATMAWLGVAAALILTVFTAYSHGDELDTVVEFAVAGVGYATLTLFPLRFAASRPEQGRERRALSLLSVGITLLTAGIGRHAIGDPAWTPADAYFIAVAAPMGLWVWAARGRDARLARNTALAVGSIALAALLLALVAYSLAYPIGRVLGVGVLGYAVLRGKIAGLDMKVRWGISRSTVTAIFIAVFFVASETASQFFGDTLGSTYIGIVAAGALVFALAPLQRAAERLAEKAVPSDGEGEVTPTPASRAEIVYKAALRAALRDGSLTRREERHLAEIVRELAIDPVHAHDWRDDVEREARGDAA